MSVELKLDAREIIRLRKQLESLPEKMQRQVLSRAIGRAKQAVVTEYVKRASDRMNIFQKPIRERTTARFSGSTLTLRVSSKQIPLAELRARVNRGRLRKGEDGKKIRVGAGVRVFGPRGERGAGDAYRQAFRATMASGYSGIFERAMQDGHRVPRLPIQELYGPNPAGEIERNQSVYRKVLTDIMNEKILKEIQTGVAGMLKKLDQG